MNETDGPGVKSAERALTILELFSQPNRALTFTQVAEMLGYPRSSLHGLLRTLTDRGWLRLDARTRRFTLGLRAWEAGRAYSPASALAEATQPTLDRLRTSFNGNVHIAVLDGGDIVHVVHSGDVAQRRVAAHATGAGKVLLAQLDRSQVEQRMGGRPLPRLTPDTLTDVDDLHRTLDVVREQDWAEACNEHLDGVHTIAVPLRDRTGSVVAALGVAAPAQNMDPQRREQVLQALRQAAAEVGSDLELAG